MFGWLGLLVDVESEWGTFHMWPNPHNEPVKPPLHRLTTIASCNMLQNQHRYHMPHNTTHHVLKGIGVVFLSTWVVGNQWGDFHHAWWLWNSRCVIASEHWLRIVIKESDTSIEINTLISLHTFRCYTRWKDKCFLMQLWIAWGNAAIFLWVQ